MSASESSAGGGGGGGAGSAAATTTAAIKLTTAGGATTTVTPLSATSTISGTPIALNAASSASAATTAAIRAIGAGGQTTQVRVVVPTTLMAAQSMIKQIDASGRTQITAMPASSLASAAGARTVSNSLTVTRPITQTAYLPRAGVTATPMTAAATATGQRLVTPLRATSAATVTGLTAGGSFVRNATANAAAVSRNSASPATTVISPTTSTTWMAAHTAGQVQLIRAIPHAQRQRIITTTQGLATAATGGGGGGVAASGANTIMAATVTSGGGVSNTPATQPTQIQTSSGQSTLQTVVASTASSHAAQQQQQPTYVATLATVLPPRQHQATLVYSSNAAGAGGTTATGGNVVHTLTQQQQQQQTAQAFNPTLAAGQRFAVTTSLTAAGVGNVTGVGGGSNVGGIAGINTGNARQIRQIPLSKPILTTKLSTASISIRAPNLPQLTPTIATVTATGAGGVSGSGAASAALGAPGGGGGGGINVSVSNLTTGTAGARSTVTGIGGASAASVIPGSNLSTTRIIQLQQPGSSTAQQLIGSTGRLPGNVMLQPFIVNTSGGNKIGLRPPVSMAAKGQPSLTITHMGLNKLPTAAASVGGGNVGVGAGGTLANASQAQTVAASLQSLNAASVATNLTTAPVSIAGVTPTPAAVSLATTGAGVNAGGLLTTQNNITSAAGGATVVPLAITTRGGTITSIKNANGITVGKVMTAAAAAAAATNSPTSSEAGGANTPTSAASVFLQQQQRTGNSSPAHTTAATTTSIVVSSSSSSSSATGAVNQAPTSTSTYLPPGGAIYYESLPAVGGGNNSSSNTTGVLSITTTTLTSSTMTSAAGSVANLLNSNPTSSTSTAVSGGGGNLPYVSVVPTSSSAAAGGVSSRSLGQLQLPITSAGGAQIQAVRFSTPLAATANNPTAAISVAETNQHQQTLLMTSGSGNSGSSVPSSLAQHMVIPLQTSIKMTTAAGSAVLSNFIRRHSDKRIIGCINGSTAAKPGMQPPKLLAMGLATPSISSAGFFSHVSSSTTASSSGQPMPVKATLTAEALAKSDRASDNNLSSQHASSASRSRCVSPASSDGSTTVSANSSPGVERQIAQNENGNATNTQDQHQQHHTENASSTHFNPIHELYSSHHKSHHIAVDQQQQNQQNSGAFENNANYQIGTTSAPSSSSSSSSSATASTLLMTATSMPQRMNGGMTTMLNNDGGPPNKRQRRGTPDSQQSNQSQPSSSYSMNLNANSMGTGATNAGNMIDYGGSNILGGYSSLQPDDINSSNSNHSSTNQHKVHANSNNNANQTTTTIVQQMPMLGNKENAKPVEYYLRRPRNCSLLNTYKANWKSANNHFQRHTDVKQREERRPTVIDMANQANVQGKLRGWKIYHLRAQMEDLAENESSTLEKLTEMLKKLETHDKTPEVDKICDLFKGNIQRNKIIVDGIHEAKNQIMKIFEHQTAVSEILSRCASKRNFKKRDKV